MAQTSSISFYSDMGGDHGWVAHFLTRLPFNSFVLISDYFALTSMTDNPEAEDCLLCQPLGHGI